VVQEKTLDSRHSTANGMSGAINIMSTNAVRLRNQGTNVFANCFARRRLLFCVAWRGVAWCGVVWRGVVWCGVVWRGEARLRDNDD
jgi:hypothetical protein